MITNKTFRELLDDPSIELRIDAAQQGVQPTGCWACADEGIIRCDGIAVNCPECNPAASG